MGLGLVVTGVLRPVLITITVYFINPSGKLKLLFDCTTKSISQ